MTGSNSHMLALVETNLYLRNRKTRRRWLEQNARESSIFEGARGLAQKARRSARISRKRRSIASRKKSVSAS